MLLRGEHPYRVHAAAAFIVSSLVLLFNVFIHFSPFLEHNYTEHIPKLTVYLPTPQGSPNADLPSTFPGLELTPALPESLDH